MLDRTLADPVREVQIFRNLDGLLGFLSEVVPPLNLHAEHFRAFCDFEGLLNFYLFVAAGALVVIYFHWLRQLVKALLEALANWYQQRSGVKLSALYTSAAFAFDFLQMNLTYQLVQAGRLLIDELLVLEVEVLHLLLYQRVEYLHDQLRRVLLLVRTHTEHRQDICELPWNDCL